MTTATKPETQVTIPQSAADFGLFEALIGRRSRRVGLGMSIPDGPLAYTSPYEPVPLSDDERALLAFATAGVTGFNLGMPHTASGDPNAGANYITRYMGRTTPSGAGVETSEALITDDTGTYITQTRGLTPQELGEIAQSTTLEEFVAHARRNLVKIADDPVRLPPSLPYINKHNWWTALQPGTTLVVPIADASEYQMNFFTLLTGEGTILWDPLTDEPIGKPERLITQGKLDPEARFPLTAFETWSYQQLHFELSLMPYNAQLALQAMGLGGRLFGGVDINSLLGAHAESGHPGFGFTFDHSNPAAPNPVGLPGYFETLEPPFTTSAREAVERFASRKFGPSGIYDATGAGPYLKHQEITSQVERFTDDALDYFTSIVEGVRERYGRFPGTGPTIAAGVYTQATHLDTDYYEKFHHPEALLDTHRNHFHDWHGGETPKRKTKGETKRSA